MAIVDESALEVSEIVDKKPQENKNDEEEDENNS